jgi:hypothetical protein
MAIDTTNEAKWGMENPDKTTSPGYTQPEDPSSLGVDLNVTVV